MDTIFIILALLAWLGWAILGLIVLQGKRHMKWLKDVQVREDTDLPLISIVIPARDEERHLETALRSLLAQDYPTIEFIVVNDRSTDGTQAILEKLTHEDSRLRVLSVSSVPEGWLGKNHALHVGAKEAGGVFLIFTDADVVMHAQALRKAMQYVMDHQLDHLTIAPDNTMRGIFLRMLAATFGFVLFVLFRPWKMRDPQSRAYIGIGAFNLVRTSSYRAINGHQPIALRPDDDLKLGKLFKKHKYRQDFLMGQSMISVEWYASVREMIQGLLKNTFAGVEYRVSLVLAGTLTSFLFHIWPFIGLVVTRGHIQLAYLLAVMLIVTVFTVAMTHYGINPWNALLFPFAMMLMVYIQWKATFTTLWSHGITWRGTFYPLAALKANRV